MKRMMSAIAFALIATATFAGTTTVTRTTSRTAAPAFVSHGAEFAGTIIGVNTGARSFVLRVGNKRETVYWTEGTKVVGGEVKPNETATVRWMEKGGRKVATSVKITGAVLVTKR